MKGLKYISFIALFAVVAVSCNKLPQLQSAVERGTQTRGGDSDSKGDVLEGITDDEDYDEDEEEDTDAEGSKSSIPGGVMGNKVVITDIERTGRED